MQTSMEKKKSFITKSEEQCEKKIRRREELEGRKTQPPGFTTKQMHVPRRRAERQTTKKEEPMRLEDARREI